MMAINASETNNTYNLHVNISGTTTHALNSISELISKASMPTMSSFDDILSLNNTDNISAPLPNEPASTETIVLLSILFCIIGSVGLLGNSLVIIVILLDRKMRQSVTNIFIMNLATADFLIMLIGVPEIVQFMINRGWLLGPFFCKFNRYILVVSLYVSILSLVSVCIERFVAISYPLKAHILCGRRKIIFAVLLIWPISLASGLPVILFNKVDYPHPSVPYKQCIIDFPDKEHHLVFEYIQFAVFYFAPVVIQAILYGMIGKKLYASMEELHTRFQMRPDSKFKNDKTSETIKARKDVVKMLVASALVYIICYAPPQVLLIYDTLSTRPFAITWAFRVFSIIISNVNSAANPVLYSIFSQNFRRNFKKCLCYLCLRRTKEYHRTGGFDSFDSRSMSRKVSSSRTTTISRL